MCTLSWPRGGDAQTFIASAQLAAGASADALNAINFDSFVKAAITTFQNATGWRPFLGKQSVRVFDPPGPERGAGGHYGGGRKLFLSGGLLSITSLTVSVTADSAGRVLTKGRDFWLRPSSAINDGEPFRFIEFASTQYGAPESIVIDGVWGFALTIPEDVWQAIISKAASDAAPQLAISIAQGLASRKAGDEEERYASGRDTGPLTGEAHQWAEYFNAIVADYKQVSL
ncbi:MAG: hypothetical protein JWQ02_1532 [Capsulimonas sp.]|nr:hypothetical protein [Capsulimonas sp.]